nr:immunoglobulin light chain junction region [Macaca mulatta]
FEQYNSLPYTF